MLVEVRVQAAGSGRRDRGRDLRRGRAMDPTPGPCGPRPAVRSPDVRIAGGRVRRTCWAWVCRSPCVNPGSVAGSGGGIGVAIFDALALLSRPRLPHPAAGRPRPGCRDRWWLAVTPVLRPNAVPEAALCIRDQAAGSRRRDRGRDLRRALVVRPTPAPAAGRSQPGLVCSAPGPDGGAGERCARAVRTGSVLAQLRA